MNSYLKKISKQRGMMLEEFVRNINRTVSAIMVVKTSANVLGASLAGFQFSIICGDEIPAKYLFPVILTIAVLFFSEILPESVWKKAPHEDKASQPGETKPVSAAFSNLSG